MRDAKGERPLLTDRVLDPKSYAANLNVQYEYMGEFDGECEAVAGARRKALRKATEASRCPTTGTRSAAASALRAASAMLTPTCDTQGDRHVREEPGTT